MRRRVRPWEIQEISMARVRSLAAWRAVVIVAVRSDVTTGGLRTVVLTVDRICFLARVHGLVDLPGSSTPTHDVFASLTPDICTHSMTFRFRTFLSAFAPAIGTIMARTVGKIPARCPLISLHSSVEKTSCRDRANPTGFPVRREFGISYCINYVYQMTYFID